MPPTPKKSRQKIPYGELADVHSGTYLAGLDTLDEHRFEPSKDVATSYQPLTLPESETWYYSAATLFDTALCCVPIAIAARMAGQLVGNGLVFTLLTLVGLIAASQIIWRREPLSVAAAFASFGPVAWAIGVGLGSGYLGRLLLFNGVLLLVAWFSTVVAREYIRWLSGNELASAENRNGTYLNVTSLHSMD